MEAGSDDCPVFTLANDVPSKYGEVELVPGTPDDLDGERVPLEDVW